MGLVAVFVQTAVKFAVMIGVIAGGVFCGRALRAGKDKKKSDER